MKRESDIVSETPEPVAVACSLTVGAVARRERDWTALLARAELRRTRVGNGFRVELEDLPGVRSELQRLIAAEHECCPFLTMSVQTDGPAVALVVGGSPQAGPILEELFAEGHR